MGVHSKQINAIKLAIKSLRGERRKKFSTGEDAYKRGFRKVSFNSEGIQGYIFYFAEKDHENYKKYTSAIDELEDLIELLEDSSL